MDFECNGFKFISDFDSGNLGCVEYVGEYDGVGEDKIYEFNIWTRPDCAGTEFANGNRTWFYFGVCKVPEVCSIKFNIVMNKQSKMYGQGMAPVYRMLPGQPVWERIKDRPTFLADNGNFFLTFRHNVAEIVRSKATVYFAFTYPFTYTDLENYIKSMENRKTDLNIYTEPESYEKLKKCHLDGIYLHREVLCKSFEGRNVHLVTITSLHNITSVREPRLQNLFPNESIPRSFKFNKKVIFLSARVHPGETPSSFVLNGIMNYLMSSNELPAVILRKHYVFKIIPMLNPDGVFHGNYRTDTRGINLNRVYNNPSLKLHPTIYAARTTILYYHYGDVLDVPPLAHTSGDLVTVPCKISKLENGVSDLSLEKSDILRNTTNLDQNEASESEKYLNNDYSSKEEIGVHSESRYGSDVFESELFLYIDMHGHASKKGIFIYGNHFKDVMNNVECRLLPKLISLNSPHFHYDSCNFSERNMYTKDKRDGSSREGSGRVSMAKATGLVRCYTLECNYNTGKKVNQLPPLPNIFDKRLPCSSASGVPPKYTPTIYEETGRQILISILDLNNLNPCSRISQSPYRSLGTLKETLRSTILTENSGKMLREKSVNLQNKVTTRGEPRSWKRPKAAAVTAAASMIPGLNMAATSGGGGGIGGGGCSTTTTITANHKKLRHSLKRSKSTSDPPPSRLEKKSSGDSRRLIPEQRRKKLKPK